MDDQNQSKPTATGGTTAPRFSPSSNPPHETDASIYAAAAGLASLSHLTIPSSNDSSIDFLLSRHRARRLHEESLFDESVRLRQSLLANEIERLEMLRTGHVGLRGPMVAQHAVPSSMMLPPTVMGAGLTCADLPSRDIARYPQIGSHAQSIGSHAFAQSAALLPYAKAPIANTVAQEMIPLNNISSSSSPNSNVGEAGKKEKAAQSWEQHFEASSCHMMCHQSINTLIIFVQTAGAQRIPPPQRTHQRTQNLSAESTPRVLGARTTDSV